MEDVPMQNGSYTILKTDGRSVGGIMKMPSQIPQEAPNHWSSYVTVDDIDAAAKKAKQIRARMLMPQTDSPDPRFCIFEYSQGATLSIIHYSKKPE